MERPSIERLREAFDYDPKTGIIINRIRRGRIAAGTVAGWTREYGYRVVAIDLYEIRAHHVGWALMKGAYATHEIDHADGDPSNNAWENLRPATRLQQMHNTKRPITNKSGFKGVLWHGGGRKWQAHIRADGVNHYLGLFVTPTEAHAAYCEAAKRLHGEFARFA